MQLTRVQLAQRTVTAASEETAREKIRAELEKPHGFLGGWQTAELTMETLGVESRFGELPEPVAQGPMLVSVKGAAEQLGVGRTIIYELIRTGEIEHVRVGRRLLVSRTALEKFIEANTKTGFYEP